MNMTLKILLMVYSFGPLLWLFLQFVPDGNGYPDKEQLSYKEVALELGALAIWPIVLAVGITRILLAAYAREP